MGFRNPPVRWSRLERALSDAAQPNSAQAPDAAAPAPAEAAPAAPAPPPPRPRAAVPFAELHAHSSFSFLDGASSPAELVAEADRLGLHALAITDHNGFYGLARFAEAAEQTSLRTVFGAELSLGMRAQRAGEPDPADQHLLVLARGQEGYHRLAAAITAGQLAGGEKGRPLFDLEQLAEAAGGTWSVLTGCRKSPVRQALESDGMQAAAAQLDKLTALFGRGSVEVELAEHGDPLDSVRNDALAELAARHGLPVLASGGVHYATPQRAELAQAMAAVRANRSLDELDGWLPAHAAAHLRSGEEMTALFRRFPAAVPRTVELADELAFELRRAKPDLPTLPVPDGHTPMSWLRELVWEAVPRKYPRASAEDRARISRELDVIERKNFPGYFLIVHGIVQEARRRGILCQGRGSAAASAVCYLLDITAVDAIAYRLPFERFLSTMRHEEPDIDVDFDSDRREEIIQWVYATYGRDRAAQVANVIQYRPKNAVRDMARALGFSTGQQDAWSKQIEQHGWEIEAAGVEIPSQVVELADELLRAPRHLGIHSGGMVLTDRPVGEVVPVEHARMQDRTVIQWDKDDAAWMGLVKFDLLGLGILAALQHCFTMIADATGEQWTLDRIPKEEAGVYDMLCRADSIGVFQVESRAQMGLLPRLRPRAFYDLAIQIALIRPGPIQGGAVHPFVRRKLGHEPVAYAHEKLRPVLERTLGIPVFQEQLMQMAVAIGDCSAEDADLLRRAMGSKRGLERIDAIRDRLYEGMVRNGLSPQACDAIYMQIQAFANFGFAESHSLSFALLVYASSWLKLHYPAAFLAGLLRAQPMGFYSSSSLVSDARRHGVQVLRPDIQRSDALDGLELLDGAAAEPTGLDACRDPQQPPVGPFDPDAPAQDGAHRRDGAFAVRLGLAGVHGVGEATASRIVAERRAAGPFRDLHDLVRRCGISEAQVEALATADVFRSWNISRREALWAASAAAADRPEYLPGTVIAVQPPLFPDMTAYEQLASDLWATGVSTDDHPIAHYREALRRQGVLSSAQLRVHEAGRRVQTAGLVTHRQRPQTASGITFLNLEDEEGLVNVVCSQGVWARYRRIARDSPAMIVRGMLERSPEGVTNLIADAFTDLRVGVSHASRDFR